MDGWKTLLGYEFSDNGLIISSYFKMRNCYLYKGHACPLRTCLSLFRLSESTRQQRPLCFHIKRRLREKENKEKMIMFKQGKTMNRETNRKKSISSSSLAPFYPAMERGKISSWRS
jgi:hypothetical protein